MAGNIPINNRRKMLADLCELARGKMEVLTSICELTAEDVLLSADTYMHTCNKMKWEWTTCFYKNLKGFKILMERDSRRRIMIIIYLTFYFIVGALRPITSGLRISKNIAYYYKNILNKI